MEVAAIGCGPRPNVRRSGLLHSPHRAVFPDADEGKIAVDSPRVRRADVHTVCQTSGPHSQWSLEEDPWEGLRGALRQNVIEQHGGKHEMHRG